MYKRQGYLMCCEPVFADVETLLKEYDVPAELTVPAVNNILVRPRCICGNSWTPEMRKTLESLRENLPPDKMCIRDRVIMATVQRVGI